MRKSFIVLFFLISILSFGQNSIKKTFYYFEDIAISESVYKSINKRKVYSRIIENDSSIIEKVYRHKKIRKIDSAQLKQITMFLTKIIGKEYNKEKKTMIHLYGQNNNNIYKDSRYKRYWKWIKKNSKYYQSFLIAEKETQIEIDKENRIYIDQYDLLRKLFFKKSEFNVNHLLIKPDGEIYIYFGLDEILHVLDWSVD